MTQAQGRALSPSVAPLSGLLGLRPQQVAVVLVDFQNDFCHPDACRRTPATNTHNALAARRANAFATRASAYGAHVIYTRQVLDLGALTPRQRRWERPDGLCAVGSWGAELFLAPVPGAHIVTKHRYDVWQSPEFGPLLEKLDVDGLVIAGVELCCCVLYAVMGADERGYHYLVAQDLVSGQDPGDATYNRAVRDYLHFSYGAVDRANVLLEAWSRR